MCGPPLAPYQVGHNLAQRINKESIYGDHTPYVQLFQKKAKELL